MDKNPYKSADGELLDEVIRQAEARLNAQLTCALGSDQRAINFASVLATLSVGLFAAGVSIADKQVPLAIVAMIVSLIISGASGLIIWGSRPIRFHFIGNTPSSFISDINNNKSLNMVKSEVSLHYDDMINENHKLMKRNSKFFKCGSTIIAFSFLIGVSITVGILMSSVSSPLNARNIITAQCPQHFCS